MAYDPPPPGHHWVFVKYVQRKDGSIIYPKPPKRFLRIPVPDSIEPKDPNPGSGRNPRKK